jgi:pantoate--beta-alanine ligase
VKVVETFADAREAYSGITGLVPTMGYLHEGHLSLISLAREDSDTVVVSLFVNPLQFDDQRDLDGYPRDVERDARLAEESGADVLFAPLLEEMYPLPALTRVTVPPLEAEMEGEHRPGHFEGMATVVAKLFAGLQPDRAYFGRKDAQQLAIVRRMAFDLSFPIEIVGGQTVRESDGLALSSRNVFLDEAERRAALGLSHGLMAAAEAFEAGVRDAESLERIVRDEASHTEIEYVTLADARTCRRIPEMDRDAFLAIAARVGNTRLIDNLPLAVLPGGATTADRGIRLDQTSILYGE